MKLLFLLVCLVGFQPTFGGSACTCDQDKLTALEEQLKAINGEVEALKKTAMPRHEVEENQIAFSVANHANFGPVTDVTTVPFPVVYTNVGNAWDQSADEFRATKTGFYLFTASFRGNGDALTRASILHTTTSGSQKFATLNTPLGTMTGDANAAILYVSTGESVSIQLHENSGIIGSSYGDIYTTFTGHFLFP